MDFLNKYFQDSVDYPAYEDGREILPFNELWCYVSGVLLNAFINRVIEGKNLGMWLLGRYTEENKIMDVDGSYQEQPYGSTWVPMPKNLTKKELFELITQPGRLYHTKLDTFSDDVLMLFKCGIGEDIHYWFFWFDMDVSDCFIGRFKSDIDESVIKTDFDEWVNNTVESTHHKPWPISNHFLSGWVSF